MLSPAPIQASHIITFLNGKGGPNPQIRHQENFEAVRLARSLADKKGEMLSECICSLVIVHHDRHVCRRFCLIDHYPRRCIL